MPACCRAILSIDGKSTQGMTGDEDARLLRGKEGTIVRLVVQRNDPDAPEPSCDHARDHPPASARLLPSGIGYARLTVFGMNTASELSSALDRLAAQGAKAYILDLRDNGGGYLNASRRGVSREFIPSGPIVSVESRGAANDVRRRGEHGDRTAAASRTRKRVHGVGFRRSPRAPSKTTESAN